MSMKSDTKQTSSSRASNKTYLYDYLKILGPQPRLFGWGSQGTQLFFELIVHICQVVDHL